MPEFPRDTDAWMRDVRDPAERSNEGRRSIRSGEATAAYRIAHLPDGRFAVCIETQMEGIGGMRIPWRTCATREECLAYFVQEAMAFFKREET